MISGFARDIKSEVQKCLACCSFFRSFVRLSNVVCLFVCLLDCSQSPYLRMRIRKQKREREALGAYLVWGSVNSFVLSSSLAIASARSKID